MARDFDDVRITFSGNVELARQYVSEARKYLGGLKDANSTNSAYRHITNSDGVRFFVANYVGQKQIEIWAPGGENKQEYKIAIVGGYLVAPRTFASQTAYSATPFVLVDPKPGNEAVWTSYFSSVPAPPLTGSTHPTNAYLESVKTVKDIVTTLNSNAAISLPSIQSLTMSWNDSKEQLFLHWRGAAYTQPVFNYYAEIYHNAKLLVNLNTFFASSNSMLLGACAKRTAEGLTIYAITAVAASFSGPFRIAVTKTTVTPTLIEQERLKEYVAVDRLAFSYAVEMQAGTTIEIASYAVAPKTNLQVWGAIVFNQSATEARGFVYTYNGVVNTIKELVVAIDNDVVTFDDTVNVQTVTVSNTSIRTYSATAKDCRYKQVAYTTGWPGVPGFPIGVYPDGPRTLTQDDPYYGQKNASTNFTAQIGTSTDAVFIPEYTVADTKTQVSMSELRCFCDYIDDVPVYGYVVFASTSTVTNESQPAYLTTTAETETVVGDIVNTIMNVTSQVEIYTQNGNSSNQTLTEVQDVVAGVKAPEYDSQGNETGYWLSVQGYKTATIEKTESVTYTHVKTTTNSFSSTYAGSYNGSFFNSNIEDRVTPTLRYINLRTKSAAYSLEKRELSDVSTVTAVGSTGANLALPVTNTTTTAYSLTTKEKSVVIVNGTVVLDTAYFNRVNPSTSGGTTVTSSSRPLELTAISTRYHYSTGAPTTVPNTYAAATDAASFFPAMTPETSYTYDHNTPYVISAIPSNTVSYNTVVSQLPSISPLISLPGYPARTIGIQTKKNSGLMTWGYYTAPSAATKINYTTNNAIGAKGTVDYVTGAHTAQFFTSPFLISAIAVKVLNK